LKATNEAWSELAGVWKDDPHFHALLSEIKNRRAG